MKQILKPYWTSSRRAISLIEVVVGLALLGGLLATTVMIAGRTTKQVRQTQQRALAIDALEELLVAFESKTLSIDGNASGRFARYPEMSWKAILVANSENRLMGTRQVRIEVLDSKSSPKTKLTSIELVVPDNRLLELDLE